MTKKNDHPIRKDNKEPKILFYDIETTLLKAWVWRCGKQVIRHDQLLDEANMWNMICITYCWNDGKPAKALTWEPDREAGDEGNRTCKYMIADFDKLVAQADAVIGKNSDRFDVKHINTHRMLNLDYGVPEWVTHTDDLEKQMRRYFALPSFSLDYFSKLLGLGGKKKMEFQDWIDIAENKPAKYLKAFKKMVTYGKKDVVDTRSIWNYCSKHFRPKFNAATFYGEGCCTNCGSTNIRKNGTRYAGQTRKQQWWCKDHNGFAGYTTIAYKYNDQSKKRGG